MARKKSVESNNMSLGVLNMSPVEPKSESIPVMPFGEVEQFDSWVENEQMGVYPLYEGVQIPSYATARSACFDLRAYLGPEIICVDTHNRILMHSKRTVSPLPNRDRKRGIYLEPGECAFIPTGIIFDIPENLQMLIFPRSGLAGKFHMKLANSVGVIDEDYPHETMVLYFNDSQKRQSVVHGDRIAQAGIFPVWQVSFNTLTNRPEPKSDRNGGLGHTGIN